MVKRLNFDKASGCWHGSLDGELDVFQAPKLIESMERVLKEQPGSVVFDCANLSYIDSMGLGAMVKLSKRVKEMGGTVRLVGLKPRIEKIFAITGLCGIFGLEGAAL